jgi:hypothetical protein
MNIILACIKMFCKTKPGGAFETKKGRGTIAGGSRSRIFYKNKF